MQIEKQSNNTKATVIPENPTIDTKEQPALDNAKYILVTFIVIVLVGAGNYITWRFATFWTKFYVAIASMFIQIVTWYSINHLTQDTEFTTGKTAAYVTQIFGSLISIALLLVLVANVNQA